MQATSGRELAGARAAKKDQRPVCSYFCVSLRFLLSIEVDMVWLWHRREANSALENPWRVKEEMR